MVRGSIEGWLWVRRCILSLLGWWDALYLKMQEKSFGGLGKRIVGRCKWLDTRT